MMLNTGSQNNLLVVNEHTFITLYTTGMVYTYGYRSHCCLLMDDVLCSFGQFLVRCFLQRCLPFCAADSLVFYFTPKPGACSVVTHIISTGLTCSQRDIQNPKRRPQLHLQVSSTRTPQR